MLGKWKKKRVIKKELQDKLFEAEIEKTKAFSKWHDLLVCRSALTILEAESKDELSVLWDEFKKNDNGMGRLGDIWKIKDRQFSVSNGRFYMSIEYFCFILRHEEQHPSYLNALEQYEMLKQKCEEIEQQIERL
ncbi:hypothetical protein H9647_20065 [Paenibacillus sp. Sa2BVA9]|uniref:Uncharacterized protein n=1 Tax=Paenibacillus gallinarum TaxID=2762232 RepID=A0ABR8T3N2_9BACL|nr:hypothetical protein [Paenibacillus gallinarum]